METITASRGGRGLRVGFERAGDRYRHEIRILDGDVETVWLVSQEGTPQDLWPPSPPLQQLSIERRRGGDVALLLGMAGRSHWSLSIEARPEGAMVFDAACRLAADRDGAEPLGAAYLVRHDPAPAPAELSGAVEVSEAGRWTLQVIHEPPSSHLRTARWRYVLQAPSRARA